jgi:replicative DNA helicase
LSFHPLWQRVIREASVPKQDNWDSAKSNMLSLYQTMMLSPDLIRDHARQMADEWGDEMKRIFDDAVRHAKRSSDKKHAVDELSDFRAESLKFLNR